MIGKKQNQYQFSELLGFKCATLWLLAYKLYRDYFEVRMFGQNPEPEKFFEDWAYHFANHATADELRAIWGIFVQLMAARAGATK